jgi:hypothetical protein
VSSIAQGIVFGVISLGSRALTQSSKASKASSSQSTLMLCLAWGIVSILFFLLFGALAPGEDARPDWFLISINFLEIFAFLLAAFLCFRNSGSSQIISGRTVWLSLGIGMLAYRQEMFSFSFGVRFGGWIHPFPWGMGSTLLAILLWQLVCCWQLCHGVLI